MISKPLFFLSFLKKKKIEAKDCRQNTQLAFQWVTSLLMLLKGFENVFDCGEARGAELDTLNTKPTKAGKTLRNHNNPQVFSIFCVPGSAPCQLSNPVANLLHWVSSICTPRVALDSSPSCPLPRNDDLYGLKKRIPCPGHWQERGGRREDGVLIFLATSLLVTAGWLCPLHPESRLLPGGPLLPAPLPESRNCTSLSAPSGLASVRAACCCQLQTMTRSLMAESSPTKTSGKSLSVNPFSVTAFV